MENNGGKKSLGRQKIDIKKIEKKSSLQVTFSKRRSGLINKVSQFSNLFGVEAAVLVESPGGKMYSFGTPSVETVINRYMLNNNVEENLEGELNWWNKPIDKLGLEELEEFKKALMGLKNKVSEERARRMEV